MNETHYERVSRTLLSARPLARKLLADILQGKNPLTGPSTAQHVLSSLCLEIVAHFMRQHGGNYSEVFSNRDCVRVLSFLGLTVDRPGIGAATARMLYHLVRHEVSGKRNYVLSEQLAQKLQHTELRGLTTDDLRLPYESVYIEAPSSLGLRVWNADTGWHKLCGVYIVEDRTFYSADRCWYVMAVGECKREVHKDDDALVYFLVPLPDATKLDEVLSNTRRSLDELARTSSEMSTWVLHLGEEWERIFLWAMNVVLYATWQEPGEHWELNKEARLLWSRVQKLHGPKRAKLQARLNTIPRQPRILLGRNIVVDRSSPFSPHADHALTHALDVRVRVSGHWRQQPFGPKSSLRRLQWIEPFWRGREDAVVSNPVHELRHDLPEASHA